jgi:polyisoprenoid-binding protein YceI
MLFPKLWRRLSEGPREGDGSGALPPNPLDGGVVSCQVHDEHGRPLADAVVSVVNRLNQEIGRGTTDAYGFFLVTVSPGTHKLSVTAGGYQRESTRAEVRTNRHTSLGTVRLTPDSEMSLPHPGRWSFDPAHTEVRFVARHIGMSMIHGRFNDFEGGIHVAERFEESRVELAIDASSIDTGVKMRDDHLRSPDFLDVAHYPQLLFTSERFTPVRGDRWVIHGALTLRGTTSPVQLDTRYLGLRSWNGTRAACRCSTELRREDYSVNWQQTLGKGIAVVGPTVQIELDVQAILDE